MDAKKHRQARRYRQDIANLKALTDERPSDIQLSRLMKAESQAAGGWKPAIRVEPAKHFNVMRAALLAAAMVLFSLICTYLAFYAHS